VFWRGNQSPVTELRLKLRLQGVRVLAPLAALAAALIAVLVASTARGHAQTFRSSIDVVQLDVSVLDRDRRPVRGLAGTDFTVLIDGQPRPVVSFDAVDLPAPPPPPTAPWMRDIAPDVVTNTHPGRRVVVILIDDWSFSQADSGPTQTAVGGVFGLQKTREIARSIVEGLGPDDLAAVMYTELNDAAQDFTNDRAKLLTAIARGKLFPGAAAFQSSESAPQDLSATDPLGLMRGSCYCGMCSVDALERVSRALRALPQMRKVVFYISAGAPIAQEGVARPEEGAVYQNLMVSCNLQKRVAMMRTFREAQLSNVTIQAIDPKGLAVGDMAVAAPDDPMSGASTLRVEYLRTVAETTGGRAVVNDNDMEREVPALFAETASYYLLGVDTGSLKDDGKAHKIEVKVNRPDVEVRTRKSFFVPTAKERQSLQAATAVSDVRDAIAGPLPKSEVPLEVSVAPFAESSGRRASLAVVLGVSRPLNPSAVRDARPERIEVISAAFEPDSGKGEGERRQTFDVSFKATDTDGGTFEALSRLPIAPGRHQVRVGVKTADGKAGSVYTYVDVPDFARDALTMSGLVFSTAPAPMHAPPGEFSGLLPRLPTARREFRAADRVSVLVRAYRAESNRSAPAPQMTARLTNASDQVVLTTTASVDAASWQTQRSGDYILALPVATLSDGEYLLTIDANAGGRTATRATRFRITN